MNDAGEHLGGAALESISVGLCAVVVAVTQDEPQVLVIRPGAGAPDALPAGPLQAQHRALEAGLRSWVERQAGQTLGYVEQLYTFGDLHRHGHEQASSRALSIGYLALVRAARPAASLGATWQSWYHYFPWEDWRLGRPPVLDALERHLVEWAESAATEAERRSRAERLGISFGLGDAVWNEERVLERYELLYESGLVLEARRDGRQCCSVGEAAHTLSPPMVADHRRILATAIARLRGKIKYRPIVFELMPPSFTFLQLQRTVEALAGVRLHKPNFRRLVEQQGVIEETGEVSTETGGRPARRLRFRREVLLERPAPGVRLPLSRPLG